MTRLTIIETDTPIPEILDRYGTYGDIFTSLLRSNGGQDLTIDAVNIVDNHTDLPNLNDPKRPDAVLVTGSKFDAHDKGTDWICALADFLGKCVSAEPPVRVVGICFGHQALARALGARVGPNEKGWEVSIVPLELTDAGAAVLPSLKDGVNIMEMHRDIVHEVPPALEGIEVTMSNSICPIQGLYKKGYVWSVQGHPEYTSEMVKALLRRRHEAGIFKDDLYDDALSRVNDRNDGKVLAQSIVKFITEK